MIIDIHTHTFPDRVAEKAVRVLQRNSHLALFSDGTEAGLQKTKAEAGVDLAVVQPVATYPEQVPSINRHVIERFAVDPPAGLISFGAMHPAYERWEEELETLRDAGLRGIKLHPPYEEIPIDDPRTVRILRKCGELDLIVLIHSGWDVGLPGHAEALPEKIRRALDAAGPVTLIAGHMAGWKCWDEAARWLAGTGIWLDTAFALGETIPAEDGYPWTPEERQMLSDDAFCDLARLFGTDHVLFGTDSPWTDPGTELQHILRLPLTRKEKEDICGENARRLLF